MRSYFALSLAGLLVLIGGIAVYHARDASRQARAVASARASFETKSEALAALRRKVDALQAEVAEAERQLAALPVPPPATADNVRQAEEMERWLGRVRTLQRHFDDPSQRIPELQLLTEIDWLRVAKNARLDDEEGVRRAASDVRNAAIARFGALLRDAIRAYAAQRGPAPPESVTALSAYFTPPVALEILARYEIAPSPSSRGQASWQVQNRAATDPDFDVRIQVSLDGGTRSSFGPIAWVPDFQSRLQRALQAYRTERKQEPAGDLAPVLPYFTPPLEPRVIDRLIKAQHERR